FFFFQAEDGIRDKLVTGVQTCALPISPPPATGPCAVHSSWIDGPPRRRIAPATPPPRTRSLLAALTMASTSCSTRSPWMITTLVAGICPPPPHDHEAARAWRLQSP